MIVTIKQLNFNSIILHRDETERRLLMAAILRKRALLQKLIVKTELLKVRLDMLKEEYTVKIGSLVLKDNSLDLRIIYYRSLLKLIKEGLNYEEAVTKLSTTYVAEELELEREREKIREEARHLASRQQDLAPELTKEVKKLWKKLITKYHPDLTQNPKEKKQREEIVKQLNKAYKDNDLETLARIQRDQTVTTESPSMRLEDVLTELISEIELQEKAYAQLKDSQWYRWDRTIHKTKKTLAELFSSMESRLLDDIVTKLELIQKLEEEASTFIPRQ